MTTVKVGYDRRCWATFEVKDATADELALCSVRSRPELTRTRTQRVTCSALFDPQTD